MRILQLNVSEYGSTGNIAKSLAKRVEARGGTSLFLYARGTKGMQNEFLRIKTAACERMSGNIAQSGKTLCARAIQATETFVPDVVHLHNLHGYWLDAFSYMEYLKQQKIPTVLTLHDCFFLTGRCAFFGNCEKWKNGCGKCPNLTSYPKTKRDRSDVFWKRKQRLFADWNSLYITAPSRWMASIAGQSMLSHIPLMHIPNGIETDIFCQNLQTRRARSVLVAAQNLFAPRKGGEYAIALAKRMPHVPFVFVGAERKRTYPDNVTVISRKLSAAEMAKLYQTAGVLLMVSADDNFPTVCLEATACGMPVAGFDAGGVKEAAQCGRCAFAPFGDMDQLQKVTEQMLDSANFQPQQFIYTADKMFEEFWTLYEKIGVNQRKIEKIGCQEGQKVV